MIGLEQDKFKSSLITRMKDYAIILDETQPDTGITFVGMGNRRTATIELPADLSDDNFDEKIDEAAGTITQKMIWGVK